MTYEQALKQAETLNKSIDTTYKRYAPAKTSAGDWDIVLRYNNVTVAAKRSGVIVLLICVLLIIKYL